MDKVIVEAYRIPNGFKVSKVGGNVKFTVRRKIEIYNQKDPSKVQSLTSKGDVFLVSESGNISVVPRDQELIVYIDHYALYDALEMILNDD